MLLMVLINSTIFETHFWTVANNPDVNNVLRNWDATIKEIDTLNNTLRYFGTENMRRGGRFVVYVRMA